MAAIALADQLIRTELHDETFSYFAYWGDKTVQLPWGLRRPALQPEG
jgi:hypothetical protein